MKQSRETVLTQLLAAADTAANNVLHWKIRPVGIRAQSAKGIFGADTDIREQGNSNICYTGPYALILKLFFRVIHIHTERIWLSNTCDKEMSCQQDVLHLNKLYSRHLYTEQLTLHLLALK